jgi:hypothetical protein
MMIFGFPATELRTQAVAAVFSIVWLRGEVEPRPDGARARHRLAGFRQGLSRCFTTRADVWTKVAEAVPCILDTEIWAALTSWDKGCSRGRSG